MSQQRSLDLKDHLDLESANAFVNTKMTVFDNGRDLLRGAQSLCGTPPERLLQQVEIGQPRLWTYAPLVGAFRPGRYGNGQIKLKWLKVPQSQICEYNYVKNRPCQ